LPVWQFASLDQAVAEASHWAHASIRDLQSSGWVWNNYPRYRLYQGEITLDSWEFTTLNQAIAEAKKWSGAHIIDLTNNNWVWDNLSAAKKEELRRGPAIYQVYQGAYTTESWKFAYLEDAVREALRWSNSTIVNVETQQTVFSNLKQYKVYQNDTYLQEFVSLDEAADYARQYAHSKIVLNGKEIWNNYPFYQVYQNDNLIGEFNKIPDALSFAMKYSNASIRTLDRTVIWDNFRKLQYWGWNGSSGKETIKAQALGTVGLDVDSPSYFELADADGNLTDKSDKETVDWLKKQGFNVYPLISNQFDAQLTTAFLSNAKAREKFIQALVDRAADLGVQGLNIDFESMSGKDRDAFTAFVKNLTDAAHLKGLLVSIDLPRGSVKWNHMSAYDHEQLNDIVDYIVIMAYDQYYRGSTSPGSVAGLQWTEEGIQDFLSYGIRRDKLILGIPYYVREWKLDASGNLTGSQPVFLKDVPALIASKGAKLTWDAAFNQYRAEYSEDGAKYVFWVENEDTVKARLALAKKYDLAGVAAWRLGYDNPDLWNMMLQQK
jgi:spore germination protein YaaH